MPPTIFYPALAEGNLSWASALHRALKGLEPALKCGRKVPLRWQNPNSATLPLAVRIGILTAQG